VSKLWGGRFSTEADALAWQFNASLEFDRRLWQADLLGSQAWSAALARGGVLTPEEHEAIESGLDRITTEFEHDRFVFVPSDEDIHTAIERRLAELIGPLAGKLHTGRSRNDQVATDFRLWIMQASDRIAAHLSALQAAILGLAEQHVETLMPGYTHLQRGQPITFAHWLMSHWWPLERDVDRWQTSRRRAAVCPLGSSALAGTAYPIDRERLAADLGFERAAENSVDAVSDRDFAAEFLFNAALLGTHLSRLAEALVLFSSAEFGFVSLADAYATGSSLMPQKKNPDVLELTRAKAGVLIGHLTGLMATLKGLPSAYDKDLQEDKPPVFAAFDVIDRMLPVVAGVLNTLTIHTDRMKAALDTALLATELADYLVRKGVPFREAHRIVGQAVLLGPLHTLAHETLRNLSPAFEGDVEAMWDFRAAVERRATIGGTAPAAVRKQIEAARRILGHRTEKISKES
jgi:argininosuccinate lyase